MFRNFSNFATKIQFDSIFTVPHYKTLTVSRTTKIYLWKVEEPENILLENTYLTPKSQVRLKGMKSELHRRAFLSIRYLLDMADYTDYDLFYDDFGKPHLKDGHYISISHSYHFTGIIISSESQVGIDIEKQRDKIQRIAHKFTDWPSPQGLTDDQITKKLTRIWCAKESIYKIAEAPGVSFLKNIYLENTDNSITQGRLEFKGKKQTFDLHFDDFEGFSLGYALLVQSSEL